MRWPILLCVLVLVGGLWLSLGVTHTMQALDMLDVNHIVQAVERDWPAARYGQLPPHDLRMSFVEAGRSLHGWTQQRDTMIPIVVDAELVGTLVIYNDTVEQVIAVQRRLTTIFYVQVALLAVAAFAFVIHQQRTKIDPFRKLERFAARVAAGDLDAPLEMDRKNRFGAFTESFDLMRDQLTIARENERRANLSKKELVASLSHDIKTPAASIKVVAELFEAKHGETEEMQAIIRKVDQIDQLISNLFSATLEELEQLNVTVTEVSVAELAEDIYAADFRQKIRPFHLPDCVLTVDRLRFRQVMDNIIGNSYKYADTEIEVSGGFDGQWFVLTIRDFGPGVQDAEVGLLCEKYYRANNAAGKNGAGFGLYLSAYFLAEMGGNLAVENPGGLCVVLRFPI